MKKQGVLLINLGTPDSPSVKDVRKYLREFLMDGYVIDLPYLTRWFLVNVIIATFRAPKSAVIYQKLWTEKGSPLLYLGLELTQLLQNKLGDDYQVEFGMRYQNPALKIALQKFKDAGIETLKVIPLYPQYASSSTKSSIEKVKKDLKSIGYNPEVEFVENFAGNDKFINAFVEKAKQYNPETYDHILFSYHGLPERHILQDCENGYCQLSDNCCSKYHSKNKLCYRAQCYHTSRAIAKELNIPEEGYSVAFQSRLETRARDPWLQPYADKIIADFPAQNKKKVLAFSPSFIADCLETTIEVGEEFKEIFEENGGEKWTLVESLNVSPPWIDALEDLVKN